MARLLDLRLGRGRELVVPNPKLKRLDQMQEVLLGLWPNLGRTRRAPCLHPSTCQPGLGVGQARD
jgi:hypothetical protein